MYFEHKHVETGPNCSRELDPFLVYHMLLKTLENRRFYNL